MNQLPVIEQFGNYRLHKKIGEGGMAEVFLATSEASPGSTPVVIKRLHQRLERDRNAVDLFLTEADVTNWAGLTGDWHPKYTDATHSTTTDGDGRVAHEMLTLCMGSSLFIRLGPGRFFPERIILFYGFDTIRFLTPAKIGDTIYVEAEVTDIAIKDDKRGTLAHTNTVYNQDGDALVRYTTRLLSERRPA